MAALGMIPPGAMPPPGPGAPPAAGAPPMAPPPAPGGASPMSGLFMLLSFLAGSGVSGVASSLEKLKKTITMPPGSGPNREHQGGVRLEAANNPNMTIAPQMAQMMAAKAAQQPSGSDELVSLLSKALMMNAGPGGVG